MLFALLADVSSSSVADRLLQQCLNGLTLGALFALIALGYTMVYGIIGLINFAHGDLFMLGSFLTLTLVERMHLAGASTGRAAAGLCLLLVVVPIFCGALNLAVDRLVYKPLRKAPKLAPLVSAIGVSFIFMNIGLLWRGAAKLNVPTVVAHKNLIDLTEPKFQFTLQDLLVCAVMLAVMLVLTWLVKWTQLGRAMRATAQNPVAAQLMGINAERVIGVTFVIGGALGGVASVIYSLTVGTVDFQMGYQNGLFAFTAAVLGGIGNIPGAVLGGLMIGLVRTVGAEYVGEVWTNALIFAILIVVLVFRPTGLLGERTGEKV